MKVLVRADASQVIGTGHIMRTLSLAEELRTRGGEITFVSRAFPGNLLEFIASRGFKAISLTSRISPNITGPLIHSPWLGVNQEQDLDETLSVAGGDWDLVVLDHYGIDREWEDRMRSSANKILVIDDLADRSHNCDFLLDQNFYAQPSDRYLGKIPDTCEALLGPKFALLRKEFQQAAGALRKRNHTINRVLVFYGGADPDNQTMVALKGIEGLPVSADIVVGPSNPNSQEISRYCQSHPARRFLQNVTQMAPLMQDADISLGAGGTTTWERCALGLPTLVTILASNQIEMAAEAEGAGVQIVMGRAGEVTPDQIRQGFSRLRPETMKKMSDAAIKMVDALGTARVVERLTS
jgi:UDP-2,4-diacetamido-2,4,6-trideoxy-beta-L-altropyranose hydrolase